MTKPRSNIHERPYHHGDLRRAIVIAALEILSETESLEFSLRELARLTSLSNAYISQLERGLHLPSVRVLKLLSEALNVSAETLLAQAGLLDLAPSGDGAAAADGPPASPVESAISAEERLADEQKAALIAVYRSMLRS